VSTVRRFVPADENQLQSLVQPLQGPGFSWDDLLFSAELVQAQTWVYEVAGTIQSFVCIRDSGEAWEFTIVATRQDGQRKGSMKALLSSVMGGLEPRRHIWLEVHEQNLAAQALYQGLGFRQTGLRGGYYRDGSAALLYTWSEDKPLPSV